MRNGHGSLTLLGADHVPAVPREEGGAAVAFHVENWRRTQETDLAVVQSFGAFSPGGRFLAAADANTIEVREAMNGSIVATVEMLGVTSLAVSADGRLLVAADDDGLIGAWSLSPLVSLWQSRLELPAPAYAQVVYDVQFAADGLLAVASKPAGVNNTLVEMWPIPEAGGRPQALWQAVMLDSDYQAFSPSPDGSRILLVTEAGYWVMMHERERLFIDGFYDSGENAVVAFSPDGSLATGIEPEGGWIYDVAAHAMREIDDLGVLEEPSDVCWSPEGDVILITSETGLAVCSRQTDTFAFEGIIDDSSGFEAAAFIDQSTVAAKRGDSLILLQRG
jgi:WD40 repeat protein